MFTAAVPVVALPLIVMSSTQNMNLSFETQCIATYFALAGTWYEYSLHVDVVVATVLLRFVKSSASFPVVE